MKRRKPGQRRRRMEARLRGWGAAYLALSGTGPGGGIRSLWGLGGGPQQLFFSAQMMDRAKLDANVVLVKLNGKDIYCDPGAAFTPFGFLPGRKPVSRDCGSIRTAEVGSRPRFQRVRLADRAQGEFETLGHRRSGREAHDYLYRAGSHATAVEIATKMKPTARNFSRTRCRNTSRRPSKWN